jgi:hypothetical protein
MEPVNRQNSPTSKCELLLKAGKHRKCQQLFILTLALTSAVTLISLYTSPYQSLPAFPYKIIENIFSSTSSRLANANFNSSTTESRDFDIRSKLIKIPPIASVCKKWKMVACAMIQNETAYLMEWIEFHRMQGVDHFVLYTYFSSDLPEYIPMVYEAAKILGIVDVIPARFFAEDPNRNLTLADYAQNREWSMVDCNVRYGSQAEWLLLMDAGHFVYSPKYKNIPEYIKVQTEQKLKNSASSQELFSAVKVTTFNFGTSGVKEKFQTWVTPNAYTGSVDFLFEPYNASARTYPLVIETNTHRAPHCKLDRHCSDNRTVSKKAGKTWPFRYDIPTSTIPL